MTLERLPFYLDLLHILQLHPLHAQAGGRDAAIIKRGGTCHPRKRVPVRYHPIEERKDIWSVKGFSFSHSAMKTRNARRVIPLVGVSLDAFKACPKGFPKYRSSSASLSTTVNKFLRSNGLMETPDHSLYGLRHSFEDRLLAAGLDERIRRDLFGHALNRERYGKGGFTVACP